MKGDLWLAHRRRVGGSRRSEEVQRAWQPIMKLSTKSQHIHLFSWTSFLQFFVITKEDQSWCVYLACRVLFRAKCVGKVFIWIISNSRVSCSRVLTQIAFLDEDHQDLFWSLLLFVRTNLALLAPDGQSPNLENSNFKQQDALLWVSWSVFTNSVIQGRRLGSGPWS